MSTDRVKPALRVTKDYSIFVTDAENRPIEDLDGRKTLLRSMQKYGFLPGYPIFVKRAGTKFSIIDGQNRKLVAHKLGLPIWYVVADEGMKISIPEVNATQKPWTLMDYARCFMAQGHKDYAELIQFCEHHSVRVSIAISLLSGSLTVQNVIGAFKCGEFKIKNREKAAQIATIYQHLVRLNKAVKSIRLLEAIYACAWVPGFDSTRIMEGATRCPEKLLAYATRDAYLTLLEDLYNFGRRQRIPIKIPAENALRDRSGGGRRFKLVQKNQKAA